MTKLLSGTASILKGLAVLLLVAVSLTGCSNGPSIKEGDIYLQVRAQQIQLDSYRNQVKAAKGGLTEVIPELRTYPAEMPPGHLSSLISFLEANDCTEPQLSLQVKENCYRVTRVLLINATRELDKTSVTLYAGQRTIAQLIDNINTLVNSLDTPTKK